MMATSKKPTTNQEFVSQSVQGQAKIRLLSNKNIKIGEVRRLRTKVATARCCLLVCSRDHLGTKYQLLKGGRHNSKSKIYPEFVQQRKHDDGILDLEKVECDTVEDTIRHYS